MNCQLRSNGLSVIGNMEVNHLEVDLSGSMNYQLYMVEAQRMGLLYFSSFALKIFMCHHQHYIGGNHLPYFEMDWNGVE